MNRVVHSPIIESPKASNEMIAFGPRVRVRVVIKLIKNAEKEVVCGGKKSCVVDMHADNAMPKTKA